tara:strand:- start:2912 stop:4687 length:1776 start_codon:yes stop_codon:yes gene_type:complete
LLLFISNIFASQRLEYETITVVSIKPKTSNEFVYSVDKINRDFLNKAQPKDLASLLRENLAIDVSNNGGLGHLSSFFLRGSNSNHTLVKINGVKINPGTAGGASIYNLDSELVYDLEIGHGPLSSLHGSSAVGGVMNISTKPLNKVSDTAVGFNLGPNNYQKRILRHNQQISENVFFNISYSKSDTDGYPVLSNTKLDRGYENSTFMTYVELEGSYLDLSFSSWSTNGQVEYMLFQSPVSQNYENYAHALELNSFVDNFLSYKLNLSTSKDLIRQNEKNFLQQFDITQTMRDSVELLISDLDVINLSDQLTLGLNIEDEDVKYASYGTIYQEKIETKSFFGNLNLRFPNTAISASLRNTDHDLYNNNLSWSAEVLRDIKGSWQVGILSGSSFRSPSSSELYGFGGNINLKPEINNSKEINLKRINNNSKLSFSVFGNKLNNLINFDFQDYVLKNINRSSNKGLEIRYDLRKDNWDLMLILKKQKPEDNEGKQLLRRSKKLSSFTFSKELKEILTTVSVAYYGKRTDFGEIRLPSFSLVNLSLSKKFKNGVKVSLKMENIMDKKYFTAATSNAFYLNQERSAWLRINYELGK